MRNIAIFASGSGTNAENIIKYFSTGNSAKVTLVLSNRREAFVLKRAAALNVNTLFFDRADLYTKDTVAGYLLESNIDLKKQGTFFVPCFSLNQLIFKASKFLLSIKHIL